MNIIPIQSPIEWMINRLWSFCAHGPEEIDSNFIHGIQPVSTNIYKNPGFFIPELILFREGIPWKWIGTNLDGHLIRKSLKIPKTNNALFIQEQLQVLRHQLVHFHDQFITHPYDPDDLLSTNKYLCRVFYKSGEKEKITLEQWIQYETKMSWWKSILALQSLLPEQQSGIGVFHRLNQLQVIDPLLFSDPERNEQWDILVKDLILCMSPPDHYWENDDGKDDDEGDGYNTKKNCEDVNHIVVKFHVTTNNAIWLSEVLEGSLFVNKYLPLSFENDSVLPEEEALHTSRRLRLQLLALAQNEVEALFVCWDLDQDGLVGVADLQQGLPTLLGISISSQACAMLIAIIGRIDPFHFSVSDLKHFVQTSPSIPRCAWIGNVGCMRTSLIGETLTSGSRDMAPESSDIADSDMDSDSIINFRCLMSQEMNDLSIEDAPHVHLDNFELVPSEVELQDMGITKPASCSDPFDSKVQAILEGTNKDISCKIGEKPLVVSNLQQLSSLSLDGKTCSVFITCDNMVTLLNFKAHTLESGEAAIHRFSIRNGLRKKLASLDISIVYSGTLNMGKYCPGQLQASLTYQPVHISESPSVEVVGEIQHTHPISLNEKFGRVVISFSPQPFIQSGIFELNVQADALTRYSVNASGKGCIFAEDVLHHKLHQFFLLKDILEEKVECAQYCWLDLRVKERTYYSIVDFVYNAENERKRSELDLEKNENLYLSTDYDEQYHVLKHLNLDFAFYCRLVSCRQRQLLENLSCFGRAYKSRYTFSKEAKHLWSQVSSLIIFLLRSIDCIYGADNASNAERIMNGTSVNAESKCLDRYASPYSPTGIMMNYYEATLGNRSCSNCSLDTLGAHAVKFSSLFHGNASYIEADPAEETYVNWGFWQPRPLPLLRSITSSGECYKEGDSDDRLRRLFIEQDRSLDSPDSSIISLVLHDTTQLFPKQKLLMDIECEINRIICNEIFRDEEEKVFLLNRLSEERCDGKDSGSNLGSDEEGSQRSELYQATCFDAEFDPSLKYEPAKQIRIPSTVVNKDRSLPCMACGCSPCIWRSSIDEAHLDQLRATISQEIILLKRNKTALSMDYPEIDRLKYLRAEANKIDVKVKLNRVDRELHDIYSSETTAGFTTVRALHGYDSLMPRNGAILSLEVERDRLLATLISHEMVDGILDWMLRGWYFGETVQRETHDKQPYELQKFADVNYRQAKLVEITEDGRKMARLCKARNQSAQTMEALTRLERNIRFFCLCLILMYFRTLHVVQKEKESWMDSGDDEPLLSEERRAMLQEEKTAKHRMEAFDYAFRKFQFGAKSRQRKIAIEAKEKVERMTRTKQAIKRANVGSLTIQRVYRGHIGRKVCRRWSQEKARCDAWNALCHASAIIISRVWRGYHARCKFSMMERDLAQYILQLRKYDHECSKEVI